MQEKPPMHCLSEGDGTSGDGGEDPPNDPFEHALAQVSASPGLKCGNVRVAGRRTSLRLVPAMWTALKEIAADREMSLDELVTAIDARRDRNAPLTNSVRTFVQEYFRSKWQASIQGRGAAGDDVAPGGGDAPD